MRESDTKGCSCALYIHTKINKSIVNLISLERYLNFEIIFLISLLQ